MASQHSSRRSFLRGLLAPLLGGLGLGTASTTAGAAPLVPLQAFPPSPPDSIGLLTTLTYDAQGQLISISDHGGTMTAYPYPDPRSQSRFPAG